MRISEHKLMCDRCERSEMVRNFSRNVTLRKGDQGWSTYITVKTGRYLDFTKTQDLCPNCTDQMALVMGSKHSWSPDIDPQQSDWKLGFLENVRNELTKEVRKRRRADG